MKLSDLEAVYKANLGLGHLEALEAIFTQGFCAGASIVVNSGTTSQVPAATAPTAATTVKLTHLDLR